LYVIDLYVFRGLFPIRYVSIFASVFYEKKCIQTINEGVFERNHMFSWLIS